MPPVISIGILGTYFLSFILNITKYIKFVNGGKKIKAGVKF